MLLNAQDDSSANQEFFRPDIKEHHYFFLPKIYHCVLKSWNSEVDWTQSPTKGSTTHHSLAFS